LYRPGLKKDELLRVACQIMQAGLERHCQSGMGFDVLVLGGQEEVLETRRIAARSD
jgi:20S proteasome alpha/beta subunit